MPRYRDRRQAGEALAGLLQGRDLVEPVVLALPRGGVPVAVPVARDLGAPLDVLLVRKVGAPGHPEFGVGALGEGGVLWLDERRIDELRLDRTRIEATVADERRRLDDYARTYRGDRPPADVAGRDVILIDDGIATGSSAIAAVEVLRGRDPRRVLIAVPVAAASGAAALEQVADEVVCPRRVEGSFAVGAAYDDFHQLEHDEVLDLLADADTHGRG